MKYLNEFLVDVLRIGGPIALSVVILFLIVRQSLKSLGGIKIKPNHGFIIILVGILAVFAITILVLFKESAGGKQITKIEIQGIINGLSGPLKGAHAYVVAQDTLKSNLTGSDGEFSIELDTFPGTSMVIHYHHPDYENDSERILISSNQIHRKTLQGAEAFPLPKPSKITLKGEGCAAPILLRKLEKKLSGKPAGTITLSIDFSRQDIHPAGPEHQGLFTYFGGDLQLSINGNSCHLPSVKIPRLVSSIGKSKMAIEGEVCKELRELQKDESIQNQIIDAVLYCI